MRAVIYARYSSDLQRDASIADQIRLCRERLESEGWQLVASYTDAAMSGAHHLRPGYQKLLEDARNGAFDIVVAEALDRLSRDQEHVAALYKRLRFCDVMLWTLAEGEITALHVGLKGTMNSIFLKDLADKTRRGLRGPRRSRTIGRRPLLRVQRREGDNGRWHAPYWWPPGQLDGSRSHKPDLPGVC